MRDEARALLTLKFPGFDDSFLYKDVSIFHLTHIEQQKL